MSYVEIDDYINSDQDIPGTYPKSELVKQIRISLLNVSINLIDESDKQHAGSYISLSRDIWVNTDTYVNIFLRILLCYNNNQYWTPIKSNNANVITDDNVYNAVENFYIILSGRLINV